MKLLRLGLVLAGFIVLLLVATQLSGHGKSAPTPAATATARPQPQPATATPPGLVVPTPAIPLPTGCPPLTAAQVDNADLYGFCTPVGWGADNQNNTQKVTLIMKPRVGGGPILLPTDFDRIVVLVVLDAQLPDPSSLPGACQGPSNDSVDGWATHHCTAPLDPARNPYHGVRAEYWVIDLANDRKFYVSATIGQDATDDEQAVVPVIVHSLKPPK